MFRHEGVIMKKYKKIIIISLTTVFLFLFAAGCSQMTEKEKIIKAVENQLKLNSYTMTGSMSFEQSSQRPVSELDIEVSFEGKYQKEPFYQTVDMNYDIMGLSMQVNLYTKDHEVWIKMPMFSYYFYLDTYEYAKEQGIEDIQKQRELDENKRKELQLEFFKSLDGRNFSLVEDNKGEKVSEVIMVNITDEDIDHIMDIFSGILMTNLIIDTEENFEELKNLMEVTELSIKIGIDKKLIKYEELRGILNLKRNGTSDEYQNIGFNILLNYDNFNKKLNFDFPDFEEEGVIRYEELFDYPLE